MTGLWTTFSIAAVDVRAGLVGIATSSKAMAAGVLVPWARWGAGAVATQALVNPTYGPQGLALLERGHPAQEVLQLLLAQDPAHSHRQVLVVDMQGDVAAHTGDRCVGWCGHLLGEGFGVAGNMLVGPTVLSAMAEAYRVSAGLPLAERLLRALEAGQAAGGDKRGRQSAALYVVDAEEYPYLDLRVDLHADPVAELRRVYRHAQREFLVYRRFLPTRANPAGRPDRTLLDAALREAAEQEQLEPH